MTTLIWNRPTKYEVPKEKRHTQYKWDETIRVEKRTPYRIVVDGTPEALEKLLALPSIKPQVFDYRPARKPTNVTIDGAQYQLYSIKKGLPK